MPQHQLDRCLCLPGLRNRLYSSKPTGNNDCHRSGEAAKAVVRRNTEEVQSKGRFDVFEELFADDLVDHTPQPNMTADKSGVCCLYSAFGRLFPTSTP
jgi:hypothetical protein